MRHGHTGRGYQSPTYSSWVAMRKRCNYPNTNYYYRYGGRGIKVCKRWDQFEYFLADMGERPKGTVLDRIDNDGNYEPSNCRWSTCLVSSQNRGTVKDLTFLGQTHCVAEWSRRLGISLHTIHRRLARGYSVREVLTEYVAVNKQKIPHAIIFT